MLFVREQPDPLRFAPRGCFPLHPHYDDRAVDHAARRKRLTDRLPGLEVDALLVTRLPNVRYLTGFTGSSGELLLTASTAVFFTDSRYEEQARHQVPDVAREIHPHSAFPAAFARAARDAGARRMGFEADGVTYRTYEQLQKANGTELVSVREAVEVLRQAKDPEEIRLIERAQELTDEAFDRVLAKLVEGITEREVALELEDTMRHGGAERIGFDSIVAFGENAAEPHHGPIDRRLSRGDVVKMDFGCAVDGYHSDMTRTVAFGDPDSRLKEIHDLVRRAQEAGIAAVVAGARGGAVDAAARAVIREAGHGDHFGHSLGHGVGLEVHEGPGLRSGSDDELPEGAVVTVEPGVYLPGLGGVRIEDMVEVTAKGCRPLPRSPRELVVIQP
jgi:Xaa-Pro aminopeptidase